MPIISIITPSYNCKQYFSDTLNSVLNQTFKDFEWIIVDDCSTDESYEYISECIKGYPFIKLYKVDCNGGSAKARNEGIREATGKYITFLDSDDLLDSNYLESQYKFILDNGPIITSGYRRTTPTTVSDFIPRNNISFDMLLKGNDISCLSTMYDREAFKDIFFDVELKYHEDFVFWLNMLKRGYVVKTNRNVLATYRLISTSKNSHKIKLLGPMYKIYRNVLGFGRFKSLYYLINCSLYSHRKYKTAK